LALDASRPNASGRPSRPPTRRRQWSFWTCMENLSISHLYVGGEGCCCFWNPSCGSCQKMLRDLKAWERNPPDDAPELMYLGRVFRGQAATEAPVACTARSQLQRARCLAARTHRAAVILDETGGVASSVGVAPAAVMALGSGVAVANVRLAWKPALFGPTTRKPSGTYPLAFGKNIEITPCCKLKADSEFGQASACGVMANVAHAASALLLAERKPVWAAVRSTSDPPEMSKCF